MNSKLKSILIPAILLLFCVETFAQNKFIHPGMLHSKKELEWVKKKIQIHNSIWDKEWQQLQASKCAQLSWEMSPSEIIKRGPYNKPDIGASGFMVDGRAAYTMSIQWYMTNDKRYAQKAIEIINGWSHQLKEVKGHDAKLLVGMTGIKFLNAAEIIKHTSNLWKDKDQKAFEKMVRNIWYPVIKDFYPTANGNWDASMIQTMLCMGVFLEDTTIFNQAKDYFLKGKGNGAIGNYFNHFGQCQESGRDQAHTQMGLAYLANSCEVAWNQGIDLYQALRNRLLVGFEYTAKYNLGHEVNYLPYKSYKGRYHYKKISKRGKFGPIYEQLYKHYTHRMKLSMPYCQKVIETKKPERAAKAHISWGTLMNRVN
ncbi:hypothetical protein EMN47_06880 [Prolixibacteraceae bacterium JC049]|nr:hypothetical protein [Prolixibacteraceae bacterium JC049]